MKIHMLLGISLMLASCQGADTPLANSSQSAVPSPDKSANKASVNVAPIAVAAAVLSIAASIKTLTSTNGDRGTAKKLNEIISQNNQIIDTLGQIVGVLQNLGVVISTNVRAEMIYDHQAVLGGQRLDFLQTWRAELTDSRARKASVENYRRNILPKVRAEALTLMDQGYGFAPFNSVGDAMLMQFWMERRIVLPRATRNSNAKTYLDYFNRALDPNLAGSPAAKLAAARAQIARMDAILAAADKQIVAGFSVATNKYPVVQGSSRCITTTWFLTTQTAKGDRKSGYSFTTTDSEISSDRDCSAGGQGGGGGNGGTHFSFGPDPAPPANSYPSGQVRFWNDAIATYSSAASESEALAKIVEAVTIYRDAAKAATTAR